MKNTALLVCAWVLLATAAQAQPGLPAQGPGAADQRPAETGPAPEPASFEIKIEAPPAVRSLLERHMALQRYRAVSDLDARELEQLLGMARRDIEDLLGTLGHFSPQIELRLRNPEAATALPIIEVRVEPGPLARVRRIQLQLEGAVEQAGASVLNPLRQRIERDWRLPAGQPFTQSQWEEAKNQALRELLAQRYPNGRIAHSAADIDPQAQTADLSLRLDSGPGFKLGALQVEGLQRYDPVLVPRLSRLAPGQDYDQNQLVQAQQRLSSSGYFDSAYVTIDTQAADPSAAPVRVQLREAPLNKWVLGLGFATDSGPRASVEHIHNRLPALGWRASTQLQLDRKSPLAQTQWTSLPDASNWLWLASVRAQRLQDSELITDTQRWRMGRRQVGERIDRSIDLQYDRSQVSGAAEQGSNSAATGEGSALSVHHGWTGRFFDSLPFPERGYAFSAEIGAGTTLSGQRQPYGRALGRLTAVVPLGHSPESSNARRSRLALRLEGATVQARASAQVPTTELFRAGGDTSVRGYGLREIGLKLPNGSTAPGRHLLTGSVEWQQPIERSSLPGRWESALFVDAGQVAEHAGDLGRDLAVGVGAGARWRSPIGPLQVDLAYGLQVQRLRLHLNVGWVF